MGAERARTAASTVSCGTLPPELQPRYHGRLCGASVFLSIHLPYDTAVWPATGAGGLRCVTCTVGRPPACTLHGAPCYATSGGPSRCSASIHSTHCRRQAAS